MAEDALQLPDDQYVLHVLGMNTTPESQGGGISDEQYARQVAPAIFAQYGQVGANPPSMPSSPTNFSTTSTQLGLPQFTGSGAQDATTQALLNQFNKLSEQETSGPLKDSMLGELKRLQYTPQQRAQDMMDKLMGTTRDPSTYLTDAYGGKHELPGQIHHNWLQALATTLGEGTRAATAAHSNLPYTPLNERLMTQATKEYEAEAAPTARNMLYAAQEQRNINTQKTQLLGDIMKNSQNMRIDAIKEEIAKQNNYLANSKYAVGDARIEQLRGQAQMYQTLGMYDQARSALAQAQTVEASNKAAQTAVETERIQKGLSAKPSSEESEIQKMMDQGMSYPQAFTKVRTTGGTWTKFQLPDGSFDFYNNKNPQLQQQLLIPQGNLIPRGTPPGANAQNDAVLQPGPLGSWSSGANGGMEKKAYSAYPLGKAIDEMIDGLPQDKLGDFKGAVSKYIDSNYSNADPRFRELFSALDSYASFMTGIHGFRNHQFVEDIANKAGNTLTNKAAMKAVIGSYQNAAASVLNPNKSIKNLALNPSSFYDHDMIRDIWNPELKNAASPQPGGNVFSSFDDFKNSLNKLMK